MSLEAIKIITCDLPGCITVGSGCVGMQHECLPKALKNLFLKHCAGQIQ